MEAVKYLRDKKIIDNESTEWIIKFEDGREIDLVDLLQEYGMKFSIELDEDQKTFLNNIIFGDAAESPMEAIQWCIDACKRIEDQHGVDACHIGFHGLVSCPHYKIGQEVWILNHESKVVQCPIHTIRTEHSSLDDPQASYYFKDNGYVIKFYKDSEIFKTKRDLINSL